MIIINPWTWVKIWARAHGLVHTLPLGTINHLSFTVYTIHIDCNKYSLLHHLLSIYSLLRTAQLLQIAGGPMPIYQVHKRGNGVPHRTRR